MTGIREFQALATNGPDQPLSEGVAWGTPNWRLQHNEAHRPRRVQIDAVRENRVAIMDDDRCPWSLGTIIRNCCAVHSAVGSAVTFPVDDSSHPDPSTDKHVDHAESRLWRPEKINQRGSNARDFARTCSTPGFRASECARRTRLSRVSRFARGARGRAKRDGVVSERHERQRKSGRRFCSR